MRFKAKPLRSVLVVPGNKEDWMRKAPQYGPDALIPDLETAQGIRQAYEIAMAAERVAHMGGSGGKGGDTA